MKPGLLLFAHGARDPRWSLPFEDVVARIRRAEPGLTVELGFLEFMSPDLPGAGERLVNAGCTRVDVVPLFLGVGGHVRKDLPVLLQTLTSAHPLVTWQLRQAIGEVDSVIEAMARAAVALTRQS